MHNGNDLLKLIRKSAVEAVGASNPTALVFGTVMVKNPLQIKLEQKIALTLTHLILSRNVTDYLVEMTVEHTTEPHEHEHTLLADSDTMSKELHQHDYKGRKTFTVHNALQAGERVALLQMQGGQKYLVLDRVVAV